MLQKLKYHPFIVRLLYWEYWSYPMLCLPLMPYWLYLCAKAKSFFFFSAANPALANGGMLLQSKKEIYPLLPENSYPSPYYFDKDTNELEVCNFVSEKNLRFPLIAKPVVDAKGVGVKKLNNMQDVGDYCSAINVDYLLQEYCEYENEMSIFYCRFPNYSKGFVTGLAEKEFVKIKGNGKLNILQLIRRNPRYIFQISTLKKEWGNKLKTILAEGEERMIVAYGRLSRGAKFINRKELITPELEKMIDEFAKNIIGFYYGRIDVKFNSWDEFLRGEKFSIIDIKGAGAAPNQIYDSSSTLIKAWKEIIHHWKILCNISIINHQRGIEYLKFKDGIKLFFDYNNYMEKINSANFPSVN